MNTQELKDILAQRILNLDDEDILTSIKKLTDNALEPYTLSKQEKNMVKEARTDYEVGKVYSHEQVKEEIDLWLLEK